MESTCAYLCWLAALKRNFWVTTAVCTKTAAAKVPGVWLL